MDDPGGVGGGASRSYGRRCVLAAAIFWSLSGVVTKSLDLEPTTIAFYRSLFAGLALAPFVPGRRRVVRPGMLPLGLVFGAMIGLYIGAIKATTAANAIFLQCTATLWLVPASALILGERPNRRALLGIGLAGLGMIAIVLYGADGRPGEGKGIAMGLASGLAYAGVVIGLRALREVDATWLSVVGNLGGAATLGVWMLATGGSFRVPGLEALAILIAFGVLQMAIPYALFARGLREIGAPEAGLIALLEPALNPIWVVLFVGERPSNPTLIGGLFLLAGIAVRYAPTGIGVGPREDGTSPLAGSDGIDPRLEWEAGASADAPAPAEPPGPGGLAMSTPAQPSIVAVYPDHASAESAVRLLHQEGFAMSDLSIVGRDFQMTEEPIGFVSAGDYAAAGAGTGAWVGGLFGLLIGAAFLILPGLGPVIVAGPLSAALLGGLEGALAGAALGGLAGALVGWGVPKEQAVKYESQVKAGKFLVVARGGADQIAHAQEVLAPGAPELLEVHDPATA